MTSGCAAYTAAFTCAASRRSPTVCVMPSPTQATRNSDGSLAGAALQDEQIVCASCASRYDARLAGRALDGSGRHLDPLPLLDDVSGIRVALQPEAV